MSSAVFYMLRGPKSCAGVADVFQKVLPAACCLRVEASPRTYPSEFVKCVKRADMATHLVLIILRKAPTEVIRVTICALPVLVSVTVITGHENARNCSKDSNK